MTRLAIASRLTAVSILVAAVFASAPRSANAITVVCDRTLSFLSDFPRGASVRDGVGGIVLIQANSYCSSVHLDTGNSETAWPAAGAPTPGSTSTAISDGSGGVVAVWGMSSGGVPVLRASRWTSAGVLQPGWQGAVAVADSHATASAISIAGDGMGGAFVAWVDDGTSAHSLYVQHVISDGTTTADSAVAICSVAAARLVGPIVLDGSGGAFVVWTDGRSGGGAPYDVYAQHVNGGLRALWTDDGLRVGAVSGSTQQNPAAATDGSGGVYIAWEDDRGGSTQIYLQRLASNGFPVSGWVGNGIPVTAGGRNNVAALADATGGVYLAWNEGTSSCPAYVNHIGGDGLPVSGWSTGGQCAGSFAAVSGTTPLLASDQAGGVRIAWLASTGATQYQLRAQTFTPSGARASGWPVDGVLIFTGGYYGLIESAVDASDGSLFVVWMNSIGGVTSRQHSRLVAHLSSDGLVAALPSLVSADVQTDHIRLRWFAQGLAVVATLERSVGDGAWTSLGPLTAESGGYLIYEDRDVRPGGTYRYRLAWTEDGATSHTAPETFTVPKAPTLALTGAVPNPSVGPPRIVFTLPAGATRADLVIFDLAGRRRWARRVDDLTAGRHELSVSPPLAPGVYRLRLSCGIERREATVTVMR